MEELIAETENIQPILKREKVPELVKSLKFLFSNNEYSRSDIHLYFSRRRKLIKSIKLLYLEGENDDKKEDLEFAFIRYFRCILSIKRLRELKEYQQDTFYYNAMIKNYFRDSISRLECLRPTLLNMWVIISCVVFWNEFA